MKRREFIQTVAAAGVGTMMALPQSSDAAPARPGKQLTCTPLVIMAPRADGFEAVWGVNELCTGRLEWEDPAGAKGEAAMDPFGFVPQGNRVLRVRVAGLQPGRTYRVRSRTAAASGAQTETSAWKDVRTLDSGAASTRFVVWNDTHMNDATIQRLDDATPGADFLLWNGDACNDWKEEEALVPALLHPGQRDITARRPLLFTWGNHDCRGAFAYQVPSIVATPSARPFYAFRSGPVACICLHTGEDKPDFHPSFKGRPAFEPLRQEQAAWLGTVIRQPEFATAPYRVVFCHIPLRWIDESPQDYANDGFDRHSGRSRAAWHAALVEWGAQVIVSGHTHQAKWIPPSADFPYGQLLGGGPRLEVATWIEGMAGPDQLVFKVRDLGGAVREDVAFRPLSRGRA